MKNFCVIFLLSFLTPFCLAVNWEITLSQKKGPVYQDKINADLNQSVGIATIKILEENKIPYKGTAEGLNSILGTPTGDAAIVVESNERMRVYGWCYEVDGVQPSVMPDKYFFKQQSAVLRWFYAFSLYDKGEWKSYCTPAE